MIDSAEKPIVTFRPDSATLVQVGVHGKTLILNPPVQNTVLSIFCLGRSAALPAIRKQKNNYSLFILSPGKNLPIVILESVPLTTLKTTSLSHKEGLPKLSQ